MTVPATTPPTGGKAIQRQVTLPISKAAEIAYKSIRMRLSRSLLVTSGIVLALAFLMSILAGEAMVGGMREWIEQAPASDSFAVMRAEREAAEQAREPVETQILTRVRSTPAAPEGTPEFDFDRQLGGKIADLQKGVNASLPVTGDELAAALKADPTIAEPIRLWLDQSAQIARLREEISGPQNLDAMMKQAGVPTSPTEIANNRIQTRWLIGLALLVAFVGILNAMLMSVTERFREIGTMKCLGAMDGFIIKLFLIESLLQGLVGTVLGVAVGLALSLISTFLAYGRFAWRNILWDRLLWAVLLCLAVGIVLTVAGALYPAWQAAKMQPVDAMRSDV